MGTLTALLHISSSALSASQTALNATADNVSNANTDGYSRRSVTWSSGDTVDIGGYSGGTGVSASVTVQRNTILQTSVQFANEAANASTTRSTALDNLQSLFTLDSSGADAAGIGAAITSFFASATTLASAPTDSNNRQNMFSAAQNLAAVMNRTATNIATQASSLREQVTSSVGQVNTLLISIATLNGKISTSGDSGTTESLKDQRDADLTSLSKLLDVSSIAGNDGSIGVSLSDGTSLVSGYTAHPLTASMVSGDVQVRSVENQNVTAVIHGGTIGGALTALGTDLPAVSSALDSIASAIGTAVNAQNALGTDANGDAGVDIFTGSTAATLSLAINSPSAIASSSDGSNAQSIGALADGALVNGQTVSAAFASLISDLGQTASTVSTQNKSDAAILTQASTQLSTETGVSLDTEAANLTQYQRSYEAAAKVLAIVNELMAQAINLGEETTVS